MCVIFRKPIVYLSTIATYILFMCGGCKKDFLNPSLSSQVKAEDFFINLSSCEQALNGCYIVLSEPFFNGNNNINYGEVIADNIKPVVGGSYLINQYNWTQVESDFTATSMAANMNQTWTNAYRITRRIAYILHYIDNFRQENPLKADDIKGQALAMRALIYFQLVNIFSQPYGYTPDGSHPGIPYVIVSNMTEGVNGRGTVAQVYQNLISDLNTAISLLSEQNLNKTNITRNAAKALLARIQLFKGDFSAAKNLAVELNNKVAIMMADYPSKLFTNQDGEAFFQLLPMQSGLNGSTTTAYAGYYMSTASLSFLATADIANLLNEFPSDKRKVWVTLSNSAYRVTKYPSGVIGGFTQPARSYYQSLFRSSEMFLTAAECYAKLNNEDSARWYVNAIRNRAYGMGFETSASGTALLDTIAKERRKELAFEGLRMFDLLRNKQGVNRLDANSPDATTLSYPSVKAVAPIPTVDVLVSGLKQNEGYN